MTEFATFKPRKYSYLTDNNDQDKKAKAIKMCVITRKCKFKDYKNCLEAFQTENKINHPEKCKIDKE